MIRRYRGLAISGVLATAAFVAAVTASGCGSTDCSFTATCLNGAAPPGSDAGDAGADAPVVVPPDCDLTKSPKDSPTCVGDGVGVFVDANGKAGAKGTMIDPVPTVAEALAKAASTSRPRVYICDGRYPEAIKLSSAVSIYGGFDCKWSNTGVKPRIVPTVGAALELDSITTEVVIEDIEATGTSDPNTKGSSAIAALVVGSKLSLRGVKLVAGPGQPGASGLGGTSNYSGSAALTGNAASGSTGGGTQSCTCVDGTKSIGGHGADGDGTKLSDGTSDPPSGSGNAGTSGTTGCMPGMSGTSGATGMAGAASTTAGVITDSGWDSAKSIGTAGGNGKPGQGGGGGGAKMNASAAGGGGGCGGCGGSGGLPGGNGGSSIALLAVNSTVRIESGSSLQAGTGGAGGAGGAGQNGQDGGAVGVGAVCDGGIGGAGAGGSGGGGGAGGNSIAIAWTGGVEPVVLSSETKTDAGGKAGAGGQPGLGNGTHGLMGVPGAVGQAIPIFKQ